MTGPAWTLMIFDESLGGSTASGVSGAVDLFPLTSRWTLIGDVEERLRKAGAAVTLLAAATGVERASREFAERVAPWSARLGEKVVGGRSIKEWFRIPLGTVSSWWFSLLSEKNPLKTRAFLQAVQVLAVARQLDAQAYDRCVIAVRDAGLRECLSRACRKRNVMVDLAPTRLSGRGAAERLRDWGVPGNVAEGLFRLGAFLARSVRVRLSLGSPARRKKANRALLFFTYYPSLDRAAAASGVFLNRHAQPLQKRLADRDRPVNWVFMATAYDGMTFREGLDYARKFSAGGEPVFYLEEFLSPGVLFRTLKAWWIQGTVCARLALKRFSLGEGLVGEDLEPLLKKEWRRSFLGDVGLMGLLYYHLFDEVFRFFSDASQCLYLCEMHAWEKALLAARGRRAPGLKTVGFQYGILPRNFYPYFPDPAEVGADGRTTDMPLPTVFAANGDIPLAMMREVGYPSLKRVEALRQFHLIPRLRKRASARGGRRLLVAGSYDRRSTLALISLVHEAVPKAGDIGIWLNSHPCTPVGPLLRELGIDVEAWGAEVKEGPASPLLPQVSWIVTDSGAGLDGLAAGCQVIVPVFSDNLVMSPLEGPGEELCKKVYNPRELKSLLNLSMDGTDWDRAKNFVGAYWRLDESLREWEEVLGHG